MDLPRSLVAIGEQVAAAAPVVPEPGFFDDQDVFAVEHQRLFMRPWLAADHASRLAGSGRYFLFDAATRSIIVSRDPEGGLHAMRNVCIHAGYKVCDAEDEAAERLVCPYHGWEYALDGRLVEPALSSRIDPERLRLKRCAVASHGGLILVDASDAAASEMPEAELPAWLGEGFVTRRWRYSAAWNWKLLRRFLGSAPELFVSGPLSAASFGPLSWLIAGDGEAALLRIMPRAPGHTDFQFVRIAAGKRPPPTGRDPIAAALRAEGDAVGVNRERRLDRDFYAWYWPLVAPTP
jgi:nitrite reductase/ring-hydroxylating ferredoxin subunit